MAKTRSTRNATPFLIPGDEGQAPVAGFPVDFPELYSLGMDRVVEIHKASLAAAVCLHSCAIDIYKSASCLTPDLGAFLDMAAKSFALCMELHSNWLTLLAPVNMLAAQAAPTADELAQHMDIACGHTATAPDIAPVSSHRSRAKRAAEKPESDMDIAIGSRVA